MKGAGAALMAALDSVSGNPGVATLMAVRSEVLGPVATDPVVKSWQRAYEGEEQRAAIAEELERIPPPAARLSRWNARRPETLPPTLDTSDAFDGDDTHPVWAFLGECETWSESWTRFKDEEAPGLEQTAKTEAASAANRLDEAAKVLPSGKERAWLESVASRSTSRGSWPVDKMRELAGLWSPERLQAEMEKVDDQLERIGFESAREQWLDRVAGDGAILQILGALREHYRQNKQGIEEDGYPHFQRALKAQPVWIASAATTRYIPMRPGLFELLVIDGASLRTLTEVLPLVYRARRLVVIGDPAQTASSDGPNLETAQALAARFGLEEWNKTLAHAGGTVYNVAVGVLPRRQSDVISLAGTGTEALSR